jgi:hypothetical protein
MKIKGKHAISKQHKLCGIKLKLLQSNGMNDN